VARHGRAAAPTEKQLGSIIDRSRRKTAWPRFALCWRHGGWEMCSYFHEPRRRHRNLASGFMVARV